ncbi:MAG: hypothetical protein HYX68_04305 [Planctomycetes bacterium]|nr:hypothetical protein [Planctomycetota bacterium]
MKPLGRHDRRKATQRRGLRILLWIPCLFLLAQISGGLVLDYAWVRPRYPMKDDMLTNLHSRKHLPEIVFLGSSRFGSDIDCGVMDAELRHRLGDGAPRTFNASLPAGDPTVSERTLEELLQQGHRPKLVVVEVEPGCLAGKDNWLYQHVLNVLDWRDVPEAGLALCRNGRIMYLVRGRLLPLCLHKYHIRKEATRLVKGMFGSTPALTPSDPPVGTPILDDPKPPATTAAVSAVREAGGQVFAREVQDFHLGGVAARRLERLLACCQSAGIKVLLVDVPVSTPQRLARPSEVDKAFLEYVNTLTIRYGCAFANWRDQVPDEYFADSHHAYHEGGVYFSRRFAARELAPRWRGKE